MDMDLENIDPIGDGNPAVPPETLAESDSFGPVFFCYSRKQALADGVQIDVSGMAAEAGFKFPVFLTKAVWREFIRVSPGVSCQDEAGRLWDILMMLRHGIRNSVEGQNPLTFQLYVRNSEDKPPALVTLSAECGPKDFDDPAPAITVMLPDED